MLALSVDQGTTSTKAVLVDDTGAVLARGSAPVRISFPRPGWVEQDAEDLWSSVLAAVADCCARLPGRVPDALTVSNQRESVVAWSRRSGAPLGPVLGWQDARTAEACTALLDQGVGDLVRRRTGLSLDPMFSAPKMRWLLDAAVAGGTDVADVCLGTVESWLLWRLTGGALFAAEAGNASRTLLFDLEGLDWHPELLATFGVPRGCLGDVRPSDAGFGTTVAVGAVPAGIPVAAVLADSHAALYAQAGSAPGAAKVTYGTGSSVMAPCPSPTAAPAGVGTTLAWSTGAGPRYAREGNVLASGAALDWLARVLGAPPGLAGAAFLSTLAAEVADSAGAALVPAFSGLGAPYWDRDATGLVTGLTAGTTREHLARAALEAVAHQVADVIEAMEADGAVRVQQVHADGGATASGLLMQVQADLLGRPVHVAQAPEASALGAALLGLGVAPGRQPSRSATPTVHRPRLSAAERLTARTGWAAAVRRSRGTPVPRTDHPRD